MKNSLTKFLSSTIALTLVLASSGAGTAQIDKIKTEDIKADNTVAVVQEVKEENEGTGIIEALEEKMKEEIPVVEVKAEPVAAPAAKAKAEEVAAPEVKVASAEIAAPEIEAVTEEEVAAPEVAAEKEAVAEWDISETASDNVAMKFYAEPTADVGQVVIDRQSGIVHISGTGAMEENVYRHFMTVERFLTTTKAVFEAAYGVEVDLVYDEGITDVLELDENIRYYSKETGEELFATREICMNLDASQFLEYSPTAIYISEGITNVSDFAFIFCEDLTEMTLPSTIESIGIQAFQYCGNLTRVVIPENAEIKEGAFSYCHSLTTVQLASEESYNTLEAQNTENNSPVKTLSAEEIHALVY